MFFDFPYVELSGDEIEAAMNKLALQSVPYFFLVNYLADKGFVIPVSDLDPHYLRCSFPSFQFFAENKNTNTYYWTPSPPTFRSYAQKFSKVRSQILQGNSFLVNLTQPTIIETNLSLINCFEMAEAKYRLWLNDCFTVFSPETFVRIEQGVIRSFPMKGTIDADIPDAAGKILNDRKEMAEHATIVDLIRNDLSIVSEDVKVERYRYIEEVSTSKGKLLQVSSEISGNLPQDYKKQLGSIFRKLLPAGSICGAPKPKTLEIIADSEGYDRNYYTGVFGLFDGDNLDSAVMIRYLEKIGDHLVFKSGGGVTSQSEVYYEYNELIRKVYVPISRND